MKELAGKTILLVEDEALIAMAETRQLQKYDLQVIHVSTGEDAIQKIEDFPEIDLVLMDINLGRGMDGTQAAQVILLKREIPLIFLSSHIEPGVVEKTDGITSYGYIVKGSGETVLMASMKMAIRLFNAKKQALAQEAALRESEASLKESQRVAHIGHWSWDTALNIVTWSDEMKRIWGIDPDDYQGDLNEIIAQAIHPDDRAKVDASNQAVLTEQHPAPLEYRIMRVDGSVRTILAVPGNRVTDSAGNILKLTGIVQDITQYKDTQNQVAQLARLYEMLSQINHVIVHTRNTDELYHAFCRVAIEFGRFCLAWVGLLDEETGQVRVVASAGDNLDYARNLDINLNNPLTGFGPAGSALRTGEIVQVDDIANDPKMQPWKVRASRAGYRSSAAIPFGISGHATGVFNLYSDNPSFFSIPEEQRLLERISQNISYALEGIQAEKEREQAIQDLRASEIQYRNIFLSIPDHVVVLDHEWHICYINHVSPGLSYEEVLGSNWLSWLQDEDKPAVEQAIRAVIETGEPMDVTYRAIGPQHEMTWYQVRMTKIVYGGRPNHVVLIARDITRMRQAEMALRASEERYRLIADNTADVIWVLDASEQRFKYISPSVFALRGYTPEEALQQSVQDALTPDSLKQVHDLLAERIPRFLAEPGRSVSYKDEVNQPRKDGSIVQTEVTTTYVFNPQGQLEIIGISRDITARKEAELLVKRALDEKKNLFKELQHRIKNSFTLIISMIDLMETPTQAQETTWALSDIRARIRALGVLYDMLYAQGDIAQVWLDEYVEKVASLLDLIPTISFTCNCEPARVSAKTAGSVGLILNELITNAAKYAFPDGKEGTVTISLTARDETFEFIVADNGIGLPGNFDWRTANTMGMLVVRNLAQELGGQIFFENKDGTRCTVRFPVPS